MSAAPAIFGRDPNYIPHADKFSDKRFIWVGDGDRELLGDYTLNYGYEFVTDKKVIEEIFGASASSAIRDPVTGRVRRGHQVLLWCSWDHYERLRDAMEESRREQKSRTEQNFIAEMQAMGGGYVSPFEYDVEEYEDRKSHDLREGKPFVAT